jgi:hypothetical protein
MYNVKEDSESVNGLPISDYWLSFKFLLYCGIFNFMRLKQIEDIDL